MAPVVAPVGTVAEIWLASLTLNVAAIPLNFTLVAPVKFVPASVTLVPVGPLVGEKLVIVGAATLTVKLAAEVAVPCGVATEIFPVAAPAGTVTIKLVELVTENVIAATPPTETSVAPLRLVPVKVNDDPTAPLAGVKLVIVGVKDCCGGVVVTELPPPQPAATTRQTNTMNEYAAKPQDSWPNTGLLIFVEVLRQEEYIASSLAASQLSARRISVAAIQREGRSGPYGRYPRA